MTSTPPSSAASLASKSTPSISASDAVLHIESATSIAAPCQDVWDVLIDTSTWPSWNTFVPRVTIREHPGSDSQSTPDNLSPKLQLGTKMTFHVHMDSSSASEQDVGLVVTEFEPPSANPPKPGRIVWASDLTAKGSMPAFLLTAERVHEVEEVDVQGADGQMKRVTEVRNWEAQVGYLVYVVRWMFGAQLKKNFEAWVEDLKQYVEGKKMDI
ncbi:Ligand-binding SRPBCC domain of an uncharacterized subfamily of protein [Aspergillus parasiticus SU-1]|uniref:Ligand-binding SRPBCC domain of an uncharacterized subfamily of protein n=1 Tax=Aspergillus parasiticus (strain ATCC 56775 / NRRL 5862 / SRRC 143 / SU-1) TaxID=1403190 RepID=A0A0F0I682_ASPPU|nr:Ligand-binding SRPBCC domain of an uncharacterized subfamily of protein [Aspergillus parasiticus SU-1]